MLLWAGDKTQLSEVVIEVENEICDVQVGFCLKRPNICEALVINP